jgi:hypothetical protein
MLFSLMNIDSKISIHTPKPHVLLINVLYKLHKTKYYLAKKRATQWVALFVLTLQLTSFYPRIILL